MSQRAISDALRIVEAVLGRSHPVEFVDTLNRVLPRLPDNRGKRLADHFLEIHDGKTGANIVRQWKRAAERVLSESVQAREVDDFKIDVCRTGWRARNPAHFHLAECRACEGRGKAFLTIFGTHVYDHCFCRLYPDGSRILDLREVSDELADAIVKRKVFQSPFNPDFQSRLNDVVAWADEVEANEAPR